MKETLCLFCGAPGTAETLLAVCPTCWGAYAKKPYAVYLGRQEGSNGRFLDLFNIVDEANVTGYDKSTVSAETLKRLGIEIPEAGLPKTGGFK